MDDKKVYEVIRRIASPEIDEGAKFMNKDRLNEIKKTLKKSEYSRIKKENSFQLYAKKELAELPENLVLVSSRIDFSHRKKSPSKVNEGKKRIQGVIDNSVANAAIVVLMLENILDENVVVAFTESEAEGKGAADVRKYLKKKGKNVRVVVIDVTSCGWDAGADFTIENNYWRDEAGHMWAEKLLKMAAESGYEWRFVASDVNEADGYLNQSLIGIEVPNDKQEKRANADEVPAMKESAAYGKADEKGGFNTFSLCIPCSAQSAKEMSSKKGFEIRKAGLKKYIQMLNVILSID